MSIELHTESQKFLTKLFEHVNRQQTVSIDATIVKTAIMLNIRDLLRSSEANQHPSD